MSSLKVVLLKILCDLPFLIYYALGMVRGAVWTYSHGLVPGSLLPFKVKNGWAIIDCLPHWYHVVGESWGLILDLPSVACWVWGEPCPDVYQGKLLV